MAWIAALIGGGLAAAGGAAQNSASKKGIGANRYAHRQANKMLEPYQKVGEAGLLSLGELMGLKGYRTQQEMDLNKYLKTAPKGPTLGKPKQSLQDKFVTGAPISPKTMGGLLGSGLEFGPIPMPGATGVFAGIGGDAEKDAAQRALLAAYMAKRKYEADLATYNDKTMPAWEKERARLQMESNQSLADYDPMKVLQATPGYMARYDQGQQAVQAQQVGRQLSGRSAQELQNAGQQFASGEYGNEVARRGNVAGIGQNAATTLGNWGIGQAGSLANLFQTQGNNTANTYANYNNVIQGTLGNYTYGQQRQKDRDLFQSMYGGY